MSREEQLEQRIAELNAAQLKGPRAGFGHDAADVWDRQIESDSRNGKLRRLIDQALAGDGASHSTAL